MDFSPDATAVAVGDVIDNIVARYEAEWESRFSDVGGFETQLWSAIAENGLAALPLPESAGGDDVNVEGLLPMLTAVGAAGGVAPVIAHAALPLLVQIAPEVVVRFGETIAGGGHLAVAINEPGSPLPADPQTTVSGNAVTGVKTGVLHADSAALLLVDTAGGVAIVEPQAPGVSIEPATSSSRWGEYTVRFDNAQAIEVVDARRALTEHYLLGIAAYADGLMNGATKLAAKHVTEREQFGKPLGTFQAVQQQIADIYVVGRTLHLASLAASWRMTAGLDAQQDLALASYWIAQELPSAMRTLTHLHGGVGVDITYPLHRYFSVAKDLARLVGGPIAGLDRYSDALELGA